MAAAAKKQRVDANSQRLLSIVASRVFSSNVATYLRRPDLVTLMQLSKLFNSIPLVKEFVITEAEVEEPLFKNVLCASFIYELTLELDHDQMQLSLALTHDRMVRASLVKLLKGMPYLSHIRLEVKVRKPDNNRWAVHGILCRLLTLFSGKCISTLQIIMPTPFDNRQVLLPAADLYVLLRNGYRSITELSITGGVLLYHFPDHADTTEDRLEHTVPLVKVQNLQPYYLTYDATALENGSPINVTDYVTNAIKDNTICLLSSSVQFFTFIGADQYNEVMDALINFPKIYPQLRFLSISDDAADDLRDIDDDGGSSLAAHEVASAMYEKYLRCLNNDAIDSWIQSFPNLKYFNVPPMEQHYDTGKLVYRQRVPDDHQATFFADLTTMHEMYHGARTVEEEEKS